MGCEGVGTMHVVKGEGGGKGHAYGRGGEAEGREGPGPRAPRRFPRRLPPPVACMHHAPAAEATHDISFLSRPVVWGSQARLSHTPWSLPREPSDTATNAIEVGAFAASIAWPRVPSRWSNPECGQIFPRSFERRWPVASG